ncbi:transporter [Paenibacillus baekrokdamisoli]|uniref:Transporter n=1 Tax=Paenibacillus baekrokdamisoli TaxID=1712516 RepID=A0A3G9JIA2_9BACL|nr:MMPL family transporter [Paenibacillus baekrokdamisoli]MBB3068986.1 RND superfamily putative drug exporter [Paenibacillus baekrokdamisoli]BBH23808.1 transporter [Paenibacillus baekrokdamisoli]
MGYVRLGVLAYRCPKTFMLIWLLLLSVLGPYSAKLPSVLKDHGLLPKGEFIQVQQAMASQFGIPADPIILVFEKKNTVSEAQFHHFIRLTLDRLREVQGWTGQVSPWEREGMLQSSAAYALLTFRQKPHEMQSLVEQIHAIMPRDNNISVQLTGKSVVQVDVNRASQHDLRKAELIGLPAAFIILWLAFGGIASAMIPVLIGMIGVTATMGIMYGLGTRMELSNFVLNVIPMVGLALSIDFALMLVSRFREEIANAPAEQAIITTMRTAGRAVLFSAASVSLGLMGLLFIHLPIFTTVALGAMTVIVVSVLLIVTLLPALLAFLTPTLQRENNAKRAKRDRGAWQKWAIFIMNRPILMAGLSSMILLGCLLPLARLQIAIPDATSLPSAYESRMAAASFEHYFTEPNSSHVYVLAIGQAAALTKGDWERAYSIHKRLEQDAGVLQVNSVFSRNDSQSERLSVKIQHSNETPRSSMQFASAPYVNKNLMLMDITIKGNPESKEAKNWLRNMEQEGERGQMRFLLGGEAKYQQEIFDAVMKPIPIVITFICLSNFMVLFLAFRSVLIPIKAIAMNLLSLAASFGILVWVFEKGHLGFEPYPIAIMIPVFIFGLVFGISMDYGVFFLSRISEAYKQSGDNDLAVRIGLASSSRIITSAAAILIVVTLPFAFGEVVGVKQLGIGIAAAVFIDATIIRLILVPALMKLLGGWNWWVPRWFQ